VHRAWRALQQAGSISPESPAGRRFAAFGARSMMAFPTGAVFGERWIEIGDDTMIAAQVTLCAGMMPGHDLGDKPVLRVGDRCVIGRGSHIVAHHSILISDDVYTGPYVYITDQNHSYADPDMPIGRQWPVNMAVSSGVDRRGHLARRRRGRPARCVHRQERGGGRRLGCPRDRARPVRGGGGSGPDCPGICLRDGLGPAGELTELSASWGGEPGILSRWVVDGLLRGTRRSRGDRRIPTRAGGRRGGTPFRA
jgi:hypothetical protein